MKKAKKTREERLQRQFEMMKNHEGYGLSTKERRLYNLEKMTEDQIQAIYQLKMVRKKLKLTQVQLAKKLGVPYATMKKWESGLHKIKRTKILELALKYIMNTHAVRTPLPGLANLYKEIQAEELERYEGTTDTDDKPTESTEDGGESEGNHPAE